MAAIVKIIGWLATVVGVIFIVLPFVSSGLSVDTMVSLCIFLLVTGPLLIALSQLIELAEKIQVNTSWFSSGGMPAAQPVSEVSEVSQPVEPEPEPIPVAREETPPEPVERPRERTLPRSERQQQQPQRPPAPELYDANVHPAAVDEWTHNGRRVMTLEDGSFATEANGAWYRFQKLEDIDALRQ